MIKEEEGKTIGYCKCGFKRTGGVEINSSEVSKKKVNGEGVLGEDINEGFEHKCRKCGWRYAEFKELGEILNSESSVVLYTCKKCGHTERETSKF
jgi:DNA-directed RNA polymerase subunit M/transcription elongation factor TFIIS